MLLKYLLEPALKRCRGYKEIKAHLILAVWDEVVGEKISKVSNASFFKNGMLFVDVKSSSWLYELTCMKHDIMKNLNKSLNNDIIKDIRFSITNFKDKSAGTAHESPIQIAKAELSAEELAQIEETVKDLKDAEMKNKIKNIMILEKRNQSAKRQQGHKECKSCGVLFKDAGDICPFCHLKKIDTDKDGLVKILNGKPWTTFAELKKQLPDVPKHNYFIIKTSIIEKYYYKLGALSKKKKLNSEEINTMLNFVMLKTEIPLEELDYKICEKVLGRKLCEHLRNLFEG